MPVFFARSGRGCPRDVDRNEPVLGVRRPSPGGSGAKCRPKHTTAQGWRPGTVTQMGGSSAEIGLVFFDQKS
jgi:hypothetical protein